VSQNRAKAISRGALRLAASLALALPLTGCFQPVYAPSAGIDRRAALQAVTVEPVKGRLGHYLTEELRFLLNGTGAPVQPKYRLIIDFETAAQTPLIDTVTGRASANSLYTRADYKVMPVGAASDAVPLAKGFVVSLSDYDRYSNRFTNVRAARDAEIRNAKNLAEQIRSRIAAEIPASP
jgi:LPS-assembly lipoprotein